MVDILRTHVGKWLEVEGLVENIADHADDYLWTRILQLLLASGVGKFDLGRRSMKL